MLILREPQPGSREALLIEIAELRIELRRQVKTLRMKVRAASDDARRSQNVASAALFRLNRLATRCRCGRSVEVDAAVSRGGTTE